MTAPATPAPRKLPVWRTVGACYVTVARSLGQFARISWLWLLILLPVSGALHWLERAWEWGGGVGAVLAWIVELTVLASIAVAWHRLILRQERVTARVYLRLDGIVWLYVRYCLLLAILVLAPMALFLLPAAAVPVIMGMIPADDLSQPFLLVAAIVLWGMGFLVAWAVAFLVLPRLSLVLPAVALGEELSLRQAWRMTRANTLRLALTTVLSALPGFLPMLSVLWWGWTDNTEGTAAYVMGELISSLGAAALAIFAVTLLSLTYRFFVERADSAPP